MYDIHAIRLFSHLGEWWALHLRSLLGIVSSVAFPTDLLGHFFQFKCNLRVLWVPGHDNPLIFIYYATVVVLYVILIFMEVKMNS